MDFSGVIKQIGEDVPSDFKQGDEIYGQASVFSGGSRAFAELALANKDSISHKPRKGIMSQISTLSSFGKEIFDLTDSAIGRESAELHALRIQRRKLQVIYTQVLPKVVPGLIGDLLSREVEYGSRNAPMYTLEVFTRKGTDSKKAIGYIFRKTGMMPAVYDKGTHYVTNQKLTLQILKEISDSDDVLEITGEYSGSCGSIGPTHERGDHAYERVL
jgi:hypothetical protein